MVHNKVTSLVVSSKQIVVLFVNHQLLDQFPLLHYKDIQTKQLQVANKQFSLMVSQWVRVPWEHPGEAQEQPCQPTLGAHSLPLARLGAPSPPSRPPQSLYLKVGLGQCHFSCRFYVDCSLFNSSHPPYGLALSDIRLTPINSRYFNALQIRSEESTVLFLILLLFLQKKLDSTT